jgi:hypothetical protein
VQVILIRFFFLNSLEICLQFKYTINPKGLPNLISSEYNKVETKNQNKFIFVFCTNGITQPSMTDNTIIIDHSVLNNYYGEAFSTKLLLTPSKINIKQNFEEKDLKLIPKIGEETIKFININKNLENFEELFINFVGKYKFEILKEYIEIKVENDDDEINDEQTKKRKYFKETDEKNKKIKLNDN